MALLRTAGCAICAPMLLNSFVEPVHRPGSTQKTLRSTGSLCGGTIRSLPMMRSCFPPVTISPASSNNGRSELFSSTSLFTSALPLYGRCLGRRIIIGSCPASVTTTSPERTPSSRVRYHDASRALAATIGNTVSLPWLIGARTLYRGTSPATASNGMTNRKRAASLRNMGVLLHRERNHLPLPREERDRSVG